MKKQEQDRKTSWGWTFQSVPRAELGVRERGWNLSSSSGSILGHQNKGNNKSLAFPNPKFPRIFTHSRSCSRAEPWRVFFPAPPTIPKFLSWEFSIPGIHQDPKKFDLQLPEISAGCNSSTQKTKTKKKKEMWLGRNNNTPISQEYRREFQPWGKQHSPKNQLQQRTKKKNQQQKSKKICDFSCFFSGCQEINPSTVSWMHTTTSLVAQSCNSRWLWWCFPLWQSRIHIPKKWGKPKNPKERSQRCRAPSVSRSQGEEDEEETPGHILGLVLENSHCSISFPNNPVPVGTPWRRRRTNPSSFSSSLRVFPAGNSPFSSPFPLSQNHGGGEEGLLQHSRIPGTGEVFWEAQNPTLNWGMSETHTQRGDKDLEQNSRIVE